MLDAKEKAVLLAELCEEAAAFPNNRYALSVFWDKMESRAKIIREEKNVSHGPTYHGCHISGNVNGTGTIRNNGTNIRHGGVRDGTSRKRQVVTEPTGPRKKAKSTGDDDGGKLPTKVAPRTDRGGKFAALAKMEAVSSKWVRPITGKQVKPLSRAPASTNPSEGAHIRPPNRKELKLEQKISRLQSKIEELESKNDAHVQQNKKLAFIFIKQRNKLEQKLWQYELELSHEKEMAVRFKGKVGRLEIEIERLRNENQCLKNQLADTKSQLW